MSGPAEPEEPPIRFKDNRRIDREPVADAGATPVADGADTPSAAAVDPDNQPDVTGLPGETGGAEEQLFIEPTLDENAQLLQERTLDLQRLSAEYANYRKRAGRERLAAGEVAVGRTLVELLPVVDDLDRAKAHGDLTGALKAVADKLDAAFGKLGMVAFGEVGDPFDPSLHEAVLHDESDSVSVPTCTTVMRVGYRHGERLLRPAMVGVTDPSTPAPAGAGTAEPQPTAEGDQAGTPSPTAENQPAGDQASPPPTA